MTQDQSRVSGKKRCAPVARLTGGLALSAALVASAVDSSADVLDMGPDRVSLTFQVVGEAGNAADALNSGTTPGIGAVDYTYRIGTYEVTNAQYAEFLNAVAKADPNGLYHSSMAGNRGGITRSGSSGTYAYTTKTNMADKPVTWVNWLDAARFSNWMHNGQPTGAQGGTTTENGAYDMSEGVYATRQTGARYFLPTVNEWYKAAYYDPRTQAQGGPTGDDNYWLYATQSDTAPTIATATSTGDIANPGTNVANYEFDGNALWGGLNDNVVTVGTAGEDSESYFGTSDQAGNLLEWTEGTRDHPSGFHRYLRGGARGGSAYSISSSSIYSANPAVQSGAGNADYFGFRIASIEPIPEPSSLVILGGMCALLMRRRRGA